MNRRKAERWLSLYLDGELDAGRSARLEAELAGNADLRALAEAWRSRGEQLRQFAGGVAPDPARGWGDVRTAMAGEHATGCHRPAPRVFGSPWSWAAAMVMVLLASVGLRLMRSGANRHAAAAPVPEPVEIEWAETELPGASTMVFRDEETGLTVVWLVENGDAEDEHAGS